jgi:hypothetical protein
MTLKECAARRDLAPERGEFVCLHPKVHSPAQRVTAPICQICRYSDSPPAELRPFPTIELGMALATLGLRLDRQGTCFHLGKELRQEECATCAGRVRIKYYRCEHAAHDETNFNQCRQCPDFEPSLRKGNVRDWAIGVVTAPRSTPTLEGTLQSLAAAGWSEPWLFAEPGSEIPAGFFHLKRSDRGTTLGLWPNWFLGLSELVLRFPSADAYLMCEDDILLTAGLRTWLEQELWPENRLGVVSLFCPGAYRRAAPGWHEVNEGWGLAGAQAFVFPPQAARMLLAHPLALHHRRRGGRSGLFDTDSVVGLWAQLSGLKAITHTPSLVQHVGDSSTSNHGSTDSPFRSASDFLSGTPKLPIGVATTLGEGH